MRFIRFCGAAISVLTAATAAFSQNSTPHGLIRYADVSATQIVFAWANDLWLVPREGGVATPLSSPPGGEVFPRFSPDGKTIAFVGNYDGGRDIYTIPAAGGVPFRVTHHPAQEIVTDWTQDNRLVFFSGGYAGLGRMNTIMTVAPTGGLPTVLPVPYGEMGAISPDGEWLAYIPYGTDTATWKRYRGGTAADIWLFNLKTMQAKRVTDWEGTDSQPMWQGKTIYYLSDNGPEHRLNIWSYDTTNGSRKQITKFTEFDIKWPSNGPGPDGKGEIVFNAGGDLYLLSLANFQYHQVDIRIPKDLPTIRPKIVDMSKNIFGWSISPTGKRAAIDARGDIWTAPAKDGSPRNITRTGNAIERDPAWSPDGRWIAYFSDVSGEYEIYLKESDGKGEARQLTKNSKNWRSGITWSPDSKHLVYQDTAGGIFLTDVEKAETKAVSEKDPWAANTPISWSHDNRWIAFNRMEERATKPSIYVYNVEDGKTTRVTSGMTDESSPTFDRKGDYLYFTAFRSFNPEYEDLGQSWIYPNTSAICAIPLRKDMKNPWLPKSDEETWKDEKKDGDKKEGEKKEEKPEEKKEQAAPAKDDGVSGTWECKLTGAAPLPPAGVSITFDLTLHPDNSVTGSVTSDMGGGAIESGKFDPASKQLTLTVKPSDGSDDATVIGKIDGDNFSGTATAKGLSFDIKGTRTKKGAQGGGAGGGASAGKAREKVDIDFDGIEARQFQLPIKSGRFGNLAVNDRNQLLYVRADARGAGEPPSIKLFDIGDEKKEEKTVASGGGFDMSADGKKILIPRGPSASIQDASAGATGDNVVTSGMLETINPRDEWKLIVKDGWRRYRDQFYDPNMHGVNWQSVLDHYMPVVDNCITREDVGFVIGEMIGELSVGHAYYFGGDIESQPNMNVGMLGVDFSLENGAYRLKRIYKGAPWETDAQSPLGMQGMDVKEGDYLLAVNHDPMDTSMDPWAPFIGMAGRTITLTVSANPTMDDKAKDVIVKAIGDDGQLRFWDWIEQNREYVSKQTNGRVGYIYVQNTGTDGQSDLVKQFYQQIDKEALIIDERWNGGGQIPTRFIELLNRPVTNFWATRHGNDATWPPDSNQGPKCMLINGLAGSGGDMFPWLFKHDKVGKVIGTRTWGGLVGLSGFPPLIDGAILTVPGFAFYKTNGTWGVEGHGTDPDIQVIDDPGKMWNGGDPQLDAGIAQMLQELKDHPFKVTPKPPYLNRSGMGVPEKDR